MYPYAGKVGVGVEAHPVLEVQPVVRTYSVFAGKPGKIWLIGRDHSGFAEDQPVVEAACAEQEVDGVLFIGPNYLRLAVRSVALEKFNQAV